MQGAAEACGKAEILRSVTFEYVKFNARRRATRNAKNKEDAVKKAREDAEKDAPEGCAEEEKKRLADEAAAKAEFEQSLERTGAGYFDYYLLHALQDDTYPRFSCVVCRL